MAENPAIWMTTTEAGRHFESKGIYAPNAAVIAAIKEGDLTGKRVGRRWYADRAAVLALAAKLDDARFGLLHPSWRRR